MTHSTVHVQIAAENRPSMPAWFGEVAIMAQVLSSSGVLKRIEEEVRFARARFGIYELIDFVAVLIGYAISNEATLQAFYERVQPFASAFMGLFGRENLPHRSTALVGIWQPWSSQSSKPCELSSSTTCSCEQGRAFPPVGCGIERGNTGR